MIFTLAYTRFVPMGRARELFFLLSVLFVTNYYKESRKKEIVQTVTFEHAECANSRKMLHLRIKVMAL